MFRVLSSLVACLLLLAACGSSGGSTSAGEWERPDVDVPDSAEPVRGEVRVHWQNLDPRHPVVPHVLVNRSSEFGGRLATGQTTSSTTRVMSDEDMGRLIEALRGVGFFEHATAGLNLDTVPDLPGQKGIVVVHQDGASHGLMLTRNLGGTPIPAVYRDAKGLILTIHGQIYSPEIRVNVDEDRIFKAPPIRMRR